MPTTAHDSDGAETVAGATFTTDCDDQDRLRAHTVATSACGPAVFLTRPEAVGRTLPSGASP